MKIKNHGTWMRYQPAEPPKDAPPHTLFVRRAGDGTDWYDYVNSGEHFAKDTIKLTVHDGIVGAAVIDPKTIFPSDAVVLEISDVAAADPQKVFGTKIYDAERKTFSDPPPLKFGPSTADLLARIEALEKGKG